MARKTGKGADIIAQGIRFTEEFSTMQLIIGVSVLMLFGLCCFLAGILVGKLDGSIGKETVAAESAPDKSEAQEKKAEPKTESKPAPKAEAKPASKPAATPPPKPSASSGGGPRVTDLPPLPPNTTPAAPKPPPAAPAAPAEPAPVLKPTAPILEAITPDASMPVESVEAETVAEAAPAPKPAPQDPPKERGSYGIQVASFNGATRNDDAAKFQRELKEKSGLDSEISSGADGYTRVLIVGFASKEDASKALSGIQQMPKLKDSFVRAL